MTDIRETVIAILREIDPDGTLDASVLGAVLGQQLAPHFTDLYAAEVQRYVAELYRGRRGATAVDLADSIINHFRLDQEV